MLLHLALDRQFIPRSLVIVSQAGLFVIESLQPALELRVLLLKGSFAPAKLIGALRALTLRLVAPGHLLHREFIFQSLQSSRLLQKLGVSGRQFLAAL